MAFNVDLSLPHEFDNIVRLFPLPNLVLFPGVMQGLHLFEPRYRQMMDDALAGDQLIAMAVLKPESTVGAIDGLRPDIHTTVCVGKIVTHSRLEDGRYNLLLVGAKRAKIVREVMTDKAYRSAEITIVEDVIDSSVERVAEIRQNLIDAFLEYAKRTQGIGDETIKNMLIDSMPLGLLVDLVSYAVGLAPEEQVRVLETPEADLRAQFVTEMIRQKRSPSNNDSDAQPNFPPDFSSN